MDVLLHGAENLNFGDNLFVMLFMDTLRQRAPEAEPRFVHLPLIGIRKPLMDEIGYHKPPLSVRIRRADKLVFFSGGYFGQRSDSRVEAATRYFRYVLTGEMYRVRPTAIIGVGVGPISGAWLRRRIMRLISNASIVTVRDAESAAYIRKYGVDRPVVISGDTAHALSAEFIPPMDKAARGRLDGYAGGRRLLFLHVSDFTAQELEKLSQAISAFLDSHADYALVCGQDGMLRRRNEKAMAKKYALFKERLGDERVFVQPYSGCGQFCAFLASVDFIVTAKLHVGIVGCTLGKSVVSFPHHGKIERYYRQIGCPERCVDMGGLSPMDILGLLTGFCGKPASVPPEIKRAAQNNLEQLAVFCGLEP